MSTPLEKRQIHPTNSEEYVPALDERWREDVGFLKYTSPPSQDKNGGSSAEEGEWLERADLICQDLDTLLRMPHHKFWSQVVFDNSFAVCIDSFLKDAPRSHDTILMSEAVREKQQQLYRLFFFTCVRMATHKESKDHFITPAVFGEILYENYIFDIPKIMDLCALYGGSNGTLLSKMIANIFTQKPNYTDDLRATVPTVLEVFCTIAKKCGVRFGGGGSSPQKISDTKQPNRNNLVTMSLKDFTDILIYMSDIVHSLYALFDVYPPATKAFTANQFLVHFAGFFECMTPAVIEAFTSRDWQDLGCKMKLKLIWFKTQVQMVKVVRLAIQENYLKPILDQSGEGDIMKHVESFIGIMTEILGERRFIAAYEHLYPFRDDKEVIMQAKCTVDETRFQFIEDGLHEACSLYGVDKTNISYTEPPEDARKTENIPQAEFLSGEMLMAACRDQQLTQSTADADTKYEELGATAKQITRVELESLITAVKDLLPDLGEGFIETCLEEFGYDTEKAINALLEDKLPKSLRGLDKTKKRDKSKLKVEEPPLIDQRLSVYDNDEFDMFRREQVDTSRIHIGKKTKVTAEELENKEPVKSLKALYDKYGAEFSESAYADDAEYEDEYDDTYDINMVGADDADSADELTTRRPFTVPRVLGLRAEGREGSGTSDDVSDEDDDAESRAEERRRRDEFVQNPAEVRAKREARQAELASRGSGRPKFDVKGRQKGQGQEKDVLRNRAMKEKNKNKNRKNMADKKRAL